MVKTTETLSGESISSDADNELEQLRNLVFGKAKQQLEQRIEDLNHSFTKGLSTLHSELDESLADLHAKLEQQHKTTLLALTQLENTHSTDKSEWQKAIEILNSQIEMAENTANDEANNIHKRIDGEVTQLESSLQKTTQDLMAHLDKVSKELSGSKTDRKKLASLLANVVSNLNADE